MLDAAETVTGTRPGPVSQMTWHQAQERYGAKITYDLDLTRDGAAPVGLGFWDHGFRIVTNSRHPIAKLEDFQGLKLRYPPTDPALKNIKVV